MAKQKRDTATVNVRLYRSTRDAMKAEADSKGKTMARVADEKFVPEKYTSIQMG